MISMVENSDAIENSNTLIKNSIIPQSSSWLITGASGFIGSQIINTLRKMKESGLDIQITSVDSGIRGGIRDTYIKETNFFNFDITSNNWPNITPHTHILHLASIASPVYYRKYPLETLDANYRGTLNILKKGLEWGSKVLLMSSSEIYGDPTNESIPTPESYKGNVSSVGPRACYDEGKRVTETLGWIYAKQFGLNITIARPFNFYGPGMRLDDGRAVPDFLHSVIKNENIIIRSDGTPTRSFCYIGDAVKALLQMLIASTGFNIYNVGNPDVEISVVNLAKLIAEKATNMGWQGEIIYQLSDDQDYLTNNPSRRVPDISLIKSSLGWEAKIKLEDGMIRTIQHFNESKIA